MSNRIQELRLVEIELFDYCNRRCNWCPNKFIDRYHKKEIKFLDENIFYNLINELAKNNYNGAITFSRYNEPLSCYKFLNYAIKEIKKILPNCKCITNTNGDYISNIGKDELLIDELTIMDYDNKGKSFAISQLNKFGATIDKIEEKYIYASRGDMKILYYLNWEQNRHITDRAGLLPEYTKIIRDRSCYEPKYFVGINYDGTVSPCCNIRNDCESTKPYIIGDLRKSSLSEILTSDKATAFTKQCELGNFDGLTCCRTCDNIGGRYTRGKGGISYE